MRMFAPGSSSGAAVMRRSAAGTAGSSAAAHDDQVSHSCDQRAAECPPLYRAYRAHTELPMEPSPVMQSAGEDDDARGHLNKQPENARCNNLGAKVFTVCSLGVLPPGPHATSTLRLPATLAVTKRLPIL